MGDQYHEPVDFLDEKTMDITRALSSLREEIEAVDWYHQRVIATKDESLRAVLAHNRDEEIEHACMALEWLRRNMGAWDKELRTYLFTEGDITNLEAEAMGKADESDDKSKAVETQGLNIGDLKL